MYEKEEADLKKMKDHLNRLPLPLDEGDQAIQAGWERAKRETFHKRKKRRRISWSMITAVLLFLTFVTSIRVSPAFASAVASIPGMEKFVHLIQNDKGLHAVFQHEYDQKVDVSQTVDGLTMTIKGVILDESGMDIFYTIESKKELQSFEIKSVDLKNDQGIPPGGFSYGHPNIDEVKQYAERINYQFSEPVIFSNLSFILDVETAYRGETISFSLPFKLQENVKEGKIIQVNQEGEIESQKFTIEEIVIYPLRTAVTVSFNKENSMRLLHFEDMRLVDEKGEVWGSITNGVSASKSENHTTYYLQSNYFQQPDKLYLQINKLQALDKTESALVINTDDAEVIDIPKNGNLEVVKMTRNHVEILLKGQNILEHRHDLVAEITDENGKNVVISSSSISSEGNDAKRYGITFETDDYQNPLYLEFSSYPNYIEGNVKIEIKE
ncbi:DUF4179 domain-containing protein [Sporosarcina sp. Te-1]|uniref:DUF4179 domain-containing protein n=1 Tax=Sporosarcina sp. Te-1 TaxID=2818390 RepID=UPI001A9F9237|nr:DUF4179 domain-containing protein [Sporosarcina sp. Te-1]QTD42991.1 DUF4179 domain-containing protein [Sporosarcina sp. Te-1]